TNAITRHAMADTPTEITVFTKDRGPLTKHIVLGDDGKPRSDGSACVMPLGTAERARIANSAELGRLLETLPSTQALAIGTLRDDLPAKVEIKPKQKLNGQAAPGIIARTNANIVYRADTPAWAVLDYDTKGMPDEIRARLESSGGVWPALVGILPALDGAAGGTRCSTSAGLYRADTREPFPRPRGMPNYTLLKDGA